MTEPTDKNVPEAKPVPLRTMERVSLPGVEARFIDDQHAVGVKFDFADQAERPSREVTNVLKNDGFGWNLEKMQWRKRITKEKPIDDRANAQQAFAEAVEKLRAERTPER